MLDEMTLIKAVRNRWSGSSKAFRVDHGVMMARSRWAKPVATTERIARFWNNVDQTGGPDACWLWTKKRSTNGYGKAYFLRRNYVGAHRIAWELANQRSVPLGYLVCHHCDVRTCVNPKHLFIGTYRDNMQDASRKNRLFHPRGDLAPFRRYPEIVLKGERNPHAKLTEEIVRIIRQARASGVGRRVLATRFAVKAKTIDQIVARRRWKHIA